MPCWFKRYPQYGECISGTYPKRTWLCPLGDRPPGWAWATDLGFALWEVFRCGICTVVVSPTVASLLLRSSSCFASIRFHILCHFANDLHAQASHVTISPNSWCGTPNGAKFLFGVKFLFESTLGKEGFSFATNSCITEVPLWNGYGISWGAPSEMVGTRSVKREPSNRVVFFFLLPFFD